jgi:hypothetical protein
MGNLDARVQAAVRHFWLTRSTQVRDQVERGAIDQGSRSAVTGGKQMDGFVNIVRDILHACGISNEKMFYNSHLELPGYYRPEKQWDVLVVADSRLIATIEFKSQSTSFGNNFNNRVEEAVGSATDLWTAYREGAIPTTPKPWLGYLMLLVDCEESTRPVSVREPHFEVFPEFKGASYAERYRILLNKLMRERLYDATCFLTTPEEGGDRGIHSEPDPDLSFRYFTESLRGHVTAFQQVRSST